MDKKLKKYQDLRSIKADYFLIGAGIMSAHLGTILNKIAPNKRILISERLGNCGMESSATLNNAGTGHAGYCEFNYTKIDEVTQEVDISKALKVNKAFKKSLEFWKHLVDTKTIPDDFMHRIPHYLFVHGEDNVKELRLRHERMIKEEPFSKMEFVEGFRKVRRWFPLVMEGRDKLEPVAATRSFRGYDIDFGKLTKYLIGNLTLSGSNVSVRYNREVIDIYQFDKTTWHVIQRNLLSGELTRVETQFVFVGAGGAAINLLHKSGIPEGKGYGGFPVSGQWLICKNPEVVNRHKAKVYGKPSVGAPPMSVPHLDTRIIDGQKTLLFGPFAGFSTKFLKYGSKKDFFKSITLDNLPTMIGAGVRNVPLSQYLMIELLKGREGRFKTLQEYYPNANINDWEMVVAGQRVQIIKEVDGKGVIEFGTEILTNADRNFSCLLGASPGASTCVKVVVNVINQCFNLTDEQKHIIADMMPSYTKP